MAQIIISLLEQAQRIGHEHAKDEVERGIAWGGRFRNFLSSAWEIVNNFVDRISNWLASWSSEDEDTDLLEEALQEEIDSLAETVASVEIPAAIEEAVNEELQDQGVTLVQWYAQPGACELCVSNAEQGPIPIGTPFGSGDVTPPGHARCRCSVGPANE